jgi:hypothetical protein
VYLYYQNGAAVGDCDIQPGYDGATVALYGIYVASQTAGDLSVAYVTTFVAPTPPTPSTCHLAREACSMPTRTSCTTL